MEFKKLKMYLEILLTFALIGHGRNRGHYSHEIKYEITEEYEKSFEGSISKRSYGLDMEIVDFKDLKSCKMCGIDRFPKDEEYPKGNNVTPTFRYPWIIALQHKRIKFCAGALISEQFILTSAHCLIEDKSKLKRVSGLIKNKTDDDRLRETIQLKHMENVSYLKPENIDIGFLTHLDYVITDGPAVEEVIPHPNFDYNKVIHDIGLLKLKDKLTCSKFRNPICLPSPDTHVEENKMFNVSGWDIDWNERDFFQDPSKKLKQLRVKYVNFNTCAEFFSRKLSKEYYCIENTVNKRNCHADPGGPLFAREDEERRYYVFGVASIFAYEMCKKDKGFIYTSVLENLDWIKNTTGLQHPKFLRSSGLQGKCKKGEVKCNED